MPSEASKYIPFLDPNREAGKFMTEDIGTDTLLAVDIAPGAVGVEELADLAVTNPKVADATLAYGKLAANEVQLTVDIPVLVSITGGTVAADAVGTPAFAHTTIVLDAETIKHLKSAALYIDHAWAATADGTIQLYDVTGAAEA